MNTRFFTAACSIASLFGLAAQAQTAATANPSGPQPLAFQSALEGYQSYTDDKLVDWKAANETTARIGGWRAYAKEASAPAVAPAPAPAPCPCPCAGATDGTRQTMKAFTMTRTSSHLRLTALAIATLVLAGCASVNIDQSLQDTNQQLSGFTQGKLELSRTTEQQQARAKLSSELLAKPLGMDDAVQLALSNSPAVQTLLAQSWMDMAQANQSGRIANPVFSFERIRFGSELEIGRLLSFGLLDLLTLPRRQAIAQGRTAQAKVQLAANVVDQTTQVRQSWIRAVSAQQSLQYAEQINTTAQASAELAKRMQQVGNFTKLQRARQQVFYADAITRLASAKHTVTATREDLIRQLGLTDAQTLELKLPERLPDLPKAPKQADAINTTAPEQRLDVQIARHQLDIAGKSQGLELLNSLVDVELGIRRDTVFDNAVGTSTPRKGFELGIRLPIFDWGNAKRDAMNANSLAAANRYESTVRKATSQLRESYSAYRTAYDVARHYRDEIVPLRKAMGEENVLRYNGMLISVFEFIADNRDQISSVVSAIDAYQQFWLADAALSASMTGKPTSLMMAAPAASGGEAAGH